MGNVTARHKRVQTLSFGVVAVHVFTDVAQVWFTERNKRRFIKRVRNLCQGSHERPKLHVRNQPMKYNPDYKQRFQLKQPPIEALERCAHGLLNGLELSLELECSNEDDRQRAFEFVIRHIVKLNHGKQKLRFVGTRPGHERARRFDTFELAVGLGVPEDKISLYTGHRGKHPHVIRVYQGRSKVYQFDSRVMTKPCVRIEWIITGKTPMERTIGSVNDLINLDHKAFWAQRLRLYDLDARKLGRTHNEDKGRVIKSGRFRYDTDQRTGQFMSQALLSLPGNTVQGVIDMFGHRYNLRSYLHPTHVCDVDTIIGRAVPWTR